MKIHAAFVLPVSKQQIPLCGTFRPGETRTYWRLLSQPSPHATVDDPGRNPRFLAALGQQVAGGRFQPVEAQER